VARRETDECVAGSELAEVGNRGGDVEGVVGRRRRVDPLDRELERRLSRRSVRADRAHESSSADSR
jgi:hypothetical protein